MNLFYLASQPITVSHLSVKVDAEFLRPHVLDGVHSKYSPVIRINHLINMNICTKSHTNPSTSWYFSPYQSHIIILFFNIIIIVILLPLMCNIFTTQCNRNYLYLLVYLVPFSFGPCVLLMFSVHQKLKKNVPMFAVVFFLILNLSRVINGIWQNINVKFKI